MLQLLNCEVEIANNGLEAVKRFEGTNFDLILMDCQMPELDGYEATRKIREIESISGAEETPIVALTAGIGRLDRQKCKDSGMNDYIAKPFSLADINGALDRHLRIEAVELGNEEELLDGKREELPPRKDAPVEATDIVKLSAIQGIREVEEQTGNSLLPSLIKGYEDQVFEKLQELRDALAVDDCEEAYKAAHAIKSMSANIGAEKVRVICAQIESEGRNGTLGNSSHLSIFIEPAIQEFLFEVRSLSPANIS